MVLSSQAGAQPLPAEEAKKDDRIRVRLHYGGKFAQVRLNRLGLGASAVTSATGPSRTQDAPNLWRYVGGEVFNESFPLEAKYADVCLRLNDKFGDTVSFKYLCPGDDLDPDNLVQVQGDDDLTVSVLLLWAQLGHAKRGPPPGLQPLLLRLKPLNWLPVGFRHWIGLIEGLDRSLGLAKGISAYDALAGRKRPRWPHKEPQQPDLCLQEMKDEYAHAVGDTRSRTVRLKIYVFRAVIFEREVQDQDAELEDEELMEEPGGDVSMDARCVPRVPIRSAAFRNRVTVLRYCHHCSASD